MYDLPNRTLYTALNNPLLNKYSFADVRCSELAKEIKDYQKKVSKQPTPEEQALLFYMSNHGFHLIKSKYKELEYLPQEVYSLVNDHIKTTNDIAKRLFYYIILISIEEGHFIPKQGDHFYDYMEQNFGPDFGKYSRNHFSGDLLSFGSLDLSMGAFLKGVRATFDFGKWQGGFGGKPWGNIVGLSASVCNGRESFEMMADHAFSLCHNNGSMFNKGHLYSMYSSFIYDILDIQASGQIPNWINENRSNKFVTSQVLKLHDRYAKIFPEDFTAPLDKQKVINSGKVRKDNEQKKMSAMKAASANSYIGSPNDPSAVAPVKQTAMDKILIGDYKKNKWI